MQILVITSAINYISRGVMRADTVKGCSRLSKCKQERPLKPFLVFENLQPDFGTRLG